MQRQSVQADLREMHGPFHWSRRSSTTRTTKAASAAYGVAEVDVAKVVGIDPKTLRKHYRDELDTGQIKATAKVAESLFRKATSDGPQSVTAAIFWLKTRAGWKETHVTEVGGMNGPPITLQLKEGSAREALLARLGQISTRLPGPEPIEANAPPDDSVVPMIAPRKVA